MTDETKDDALDKQRIQQEALRQSANDGKSMGLDAICARISADVTAHAAQIKKERDAAKK